MEPDPDEQEFPGEEELDWDEETANQFRGKKPKGLFSKTTEKARGMIPSERVCALFCGGKKCKYCSSEVWPKEQMVIQGLYSHWITDNILAMARPSNEAIKKYNLVQQFKDHGINSIVNTQIAGEHADCGPHKLDPSGFLYNPQTFMEQGVFFYNFGWPDYGVASLATILDMVKVMQFAVSQGKVAVHCHAGRGRTGVIIACYLVFTNRIGGRDAIHYVREKRPNSIQTRQQMLVIQEFEKYLKPFRIVFASKERGSHEFSLQQYLNRQRHILHGYEARRLKYVPKIIYTICERLLELAQKGSSLQRLNSKNSLKSLDKTLSTIISHSKSTQESPIAKQKSKESLKSAERLRREHVTLSNTRNRFRSVSLEDLPNSEFKDVLDEADSDSVGSGSVDKLSRDLNDDEDDEDDDDDNSIVFGHSAADLKALVDTDKERTRREMKHRDSGLSTISDKSGCSDWTIDQMPSKDFLESSVKIIGEALSDDHVGDSVLDEAARLEILLNESDTAWTVIAEEKNARILSQVMWDWLDQLKEPVLRIQDLNSMLTYLEDPLTGLQKLEKGTRYTIEYLTKVIGKLKPLDDSVQYQIYEKLLSHLCHQWVQYSDSKFNNSWAMSTMSSEASQSFKEHWSEMRQNLAHKLFIFFFNLKTVLCKDKHS